MQWYELLLLIAGIFPLLIFIDYRAKRKADNTPEIEFDLNSRMTISGLTFVPFVLLFYTENFWDNFLYFIPLYAYFYVWMMIASHKSWCPYTFTDLKIFGLSGFIGTIIAYYLFFHEGVLDDPLNAESVNAQRESEQGMSERIYSDWPYYTALGLAVMTLLTLSLERLFKKNPDVSSLMLFLLAIALPSLSLFIEHYWWGLMGAVLILGTFIPLVLNAFDDTARGAIVFVVGYFFMMACVASILLYAFLF